MRYFASLNMTSCQGISLEGGGMARSASHTATTPKKIWVVISTEKSK
jgi:hypothetical protein